MTVEQINQNQTNEFLDRAATELEAFHISGEMRDRIKRAGSAIVGTGYFEALFDEDSVATPEERLAGTFTGCIAFERPELAQEAFSLLVKISGGYTQTLETTLVNSLGTAKRGERRFKLEGYVGRVQRLRTASRELQTRERTCIGVGETAVAHAVVAKYAA